MKPPKRCHCATCDGAWSVAFIVIAAVVIAAALGAGLGALLPVGEAVL